MNMLCHVEDCPELGLRKLTYTTGELRYEELYDTEAGRHLSGQVYLYDKIRACSVFDRESILLTMPVDWVMNHKDMLALIADLKRLDAFLSEMVPSYGGLQGNSDTRG